MRRWAGLLAAAALVALVACETGDGGPAPGGRAHADAAAQPGQTREELVKALEAKARSLERRVALARPGRDRLVAAQDADVAWKRWAEVSGKPLPASARRIAQIAAKEEKAAALEEAKQGQSLPFVPSAGEPANRRPEKRSGW